MTFGAVDNISTCKYLISTYVRLPAKRMTHHFPLWDRTEKINPETLSLIPLVIYVLMPGISTTSTDT